MNGSFAIFERDMRKFLRSPLLLFMSLFFPMFYLIVLGNAIGGTINHVPIGMAQVDLFYGETKEFKTTLQAIQGTDSFTVTVYDTEEEAKRALSEGKVYAVAVFPSDRYNENTIWLYIDSSDSFISSVIEGGFPAIIKGLGLNNDIQIDKIYGKIEYLESFGVAILIMSIFMSSMMGGGMALIRDREAGIIEGYYVTPIKRSSILGGIIMSGTARGLLTSCVVLIIDVLIAGVVVKDMQSLALVIGVLFLTSVGTTSFVVSFASRIPSQQAYGSTVGFFNLLLFMTSGAFYPTIAMPSWLSWMTNINPEYYAIHALRGILLRGQGFDVIGFDLLAICLFSFAMIAFGILVFKRSLE